jgi:hypothetical protein
VRRSVRLAGGFLCSLALLLQGCYQTLPLQQGVPPGAETVQLVLNDEGRVEVASMLGSAVDKVEGIVTGQNAQSYTLSVSRVMQLNGNTSKWSGEKVTVAKNGVDGYQVYRLNKKRTVMLVIAIVVGAVVVFTSLSLAGSGGTTQTGGQPGGGQQSQRVP